MAVAVIASVLPAARAARVDVMEALRSELDHRKTSMDLACPM